MKAKLTFLLIALLLAGTITLLLLLNRREAPLPAIASAPAPLAAPRPSPAPLAATNSAVFTASQRRSAAPAPVIDGITVPKRIAQAIGLDPDLDFHARLAAIRELQPDLAPDEVHLLCDFVRGRFDTSDLRLTTVLKNDVLDLLLRLPNPTNEIYLAMIEVYNDPSQDPVMRDYAIQHLFTWCAEVHRNSEIIDVIWKATAETQTSIGGTALLGLHRLDQHQPLQGTARIDQAALKFIQDPAGGELARITSIQICAERNLQSALPVLNTLAQATNSVPVQIAALAALGQMGNQGHRALLNQILDAGNPRLQVAAKAALRKLDTRLNSAAALQ